MTASALANLDDRAQARPFRFRSALLLSGMWGSMLYVVADIVGGIASGVYGARLAANETTPGFGLVERTMIYGFLIWVFLLSWVLLRAPTERTGVKK